MTQQPLEVRVSIMEEKHKTLSERYIEVCDKLTGLEKAQARHELTNVEILGAVNLINNKLDTKKENNNIWWPVIFVVAFEIIKEVAISLFNIV